MKSIGLVLLSLLFLACGSQQQIIRYYTLDAYALELPDTVVDWDGVPLPFIVEVPRFRIAGPYNQNRIALRTETNELQYYYYHHWADLPGSAVTYFVWKQVYDAGLFDICGMHIYDYQPTHQIAGTVHRIERVEINGMAGAHLRVSLEFNDIEKRQTVVRHTFDRLQLLEDIRSMNAFAEEVSRILYEETEQFMMMIIAHYR